jgi:5'-nucleotidase / UDP-sugar diphosphatase
MLKQCGRLVVQLLLLSFTLTSPGMTQADVVQFTVLHTNDFHGNLELSGSNPGAARLASKIKAIRAAKGALGQQVLLFDAGDILQGTLLSNLMEGQPTIQYYKTIGYDAVTFGNHEFDWGQTVLAARVSQAINDDGDPGTKEFPFLAANIVLQGTAPDCASAGWDLPPFIPEAYQVFNLTTATTPLRVGVIGVTTPETSSITKTSATAGLCFKDPAEAILHYYDALREAADVLIVLSHLGYTDGGYGYGFPVYGDQTLAARLNEASKPVHLIIGGHSHTNLSAPKKIGNIQVVQAYYAGRKLGQVDFTVDRGTGVVTQTWTPNAISTGDPADPAQRPAAQGRSGTQLPQLLLL